VRGKGSIGYKKRIFTIGSDCERKDEGEVNDEEEDQRGGMNMRLLHVQDICANEIIIIIVRILSLEVTCLCILICM